MPEYLSPGVYIEEQDTGPEPIEGVSTSVTGFVGVTQMGPLDLNPPVLVTSFPEFQRTFGTYFTPQFTTTPSGGDSYNLLPYAVAGFFNNGGQLLYIKRVGSVATPPASASAGPNLVNTDTALTPPLPIMTRLTSSAPAGATTLQLASVRGIENDTTLVLTQIKNGVTTSSPTLTVTGYNSQTDMVTFTPALPALPAPFTYYDWEYTEVETTGTTTAYNPAANTSEFLLQASSPGFWGNNLQVEITPSSRAQAQVSAEVAADTYTLNSASNMYVGAIVEFDIGSIYTVAGTAAGAFTAGGLVTQVGTGATANLVGAPSASTMTIALLSGSPNASGIWNASGGATFTPSALPAPVSGGKFYAKVKAISGPTIQLLSALTGATQVSNNVASSIPVTVSTCEFDVNAAYGYVNESFRGLTLDNTTPYYFATTINNNSSLLNVPYLPLILPPTLPSDQTTQDPSTMPVALDGITVSFTGGTDGACPLASDYVGVDGGPGARTGIAALVDASEISIIGAPGKTDQTTQGALISQCENLLYRFAILDPQPTSTGGAPTMTTIQAQRDLYDTEYAAIYFPRIVISDPISGNPLPICPSGHMAGIYAQTDDTRGVWKAPANVVVNGILNFEIKLSKGDQDILNPEPNNINALRDFTAQGRGLRVYGARVITSDEEWKYINVRRLFIFLEASLDQGTQWAVFEPNDQTLWSRLIQSVSAFLTTIWRQGGLMGATADQAFFVKCGYDTMSSDDIENGRLIMLVGVAPVFPAEFVIIRIGQWAGGSSVQEL